VRKITILANAFLLGGFTLTAGVSLEYFINRFFTDVNSWIEYHNLESIYPSFKYYEDINLMSTRSVYKPTKVVWNDILKCPGFRSSISTSEYLEPSNGKERHAWSYLGKRPSDNTQCRVTREYTITGPYGLEKHGNVNSNWFVIKYTRSQ
jgi:hypothetical protein